MKLHFQAFCTQAAGPGPGTRGPGPGRRAGRPGAAQARALGPQGPGHPPTAGMIPQRVKEMQTVIFLWIFAVRGHGVTLQRFPNFQILIVVLHLFLLFFLN